MQCIGALALVLNPSHICVPWDNDSSYICSVIRYCILYVKIPSGMFFKRMSLKKPYQKQVQPSFWLSGSPKLIATTRVMELKIAWAVDDPKNHSQHVQASIWQSTCSLKKEHNPLGSYKQLNILWKCQTISRKRIFNCLRSIFFQLVRQLLIFTCFFFPPWKSQISLHFRGQLFN